MRRMAHLWVGVAMTSAAAMPPEQRAGVDPAAREAGERSTRTDPAGAARTDQPSGQRPPVRVILPSPYSARR